jgi:hypothetical protein
VTGIADEEGKMHSLLDPFGLDLDDDAVTKPNRVLELRAEVVHLPLFYTATWKIVVYVDGKEYISSDEVDRRPSKDVVDDWVRQIIRFHITTLSGMQVDVSSAYERYGGDRRDLFGF